MRTIDSIGAYFEDFRARFEPALKGFLSDAHQRIQTLDPWGVTLVEAITDFSLRGGKRIRPALVQLGYEATGGDPDDRLLQPAVAVELAHSFLLIHDDIMDRSKVRRHRPTAHRWLRDRLAAISPGWSSADLDHFGNSLAIVAGDLCSMLSMRALASADYPPDRITAATRRLIEVVTVTTVGQAVDLTLGRQSELDERRIEQVHMLKTGTYSLEGPLHLGVILADGSTELRRQLSRFAVPLGIAFQVRDDILGVFGTEDELGKSVTSDIEEGKRTRLTVFVEQHGTESQRRQLAAVLGRSGLNAEQLEEVRELFRSSGALEDSQQAIQRLSAESQAAVRECHIPSQVRKRLAELTEFLVRRTT